MNNRCSNNERTLLHLVCQSGCFKFINECFNQLTFTEFEQLEQIKTNDNKTSIQLAIDNKFENKLNFFKYLNKQDDSKNTIFHKMVLNNKTNSLRLILEYLSSNDLIDTIGFGLKNKRNKTAFDLAYDLNNCEAIYLLNHFSHANNNDTNKSSNNANIINIENYLKIKPDKYATKIRNLIFEGGGVKGLAYVGALEKSIETNLIDLNEIKRLAGTSAGSITATLLGVGYDTNDLKQLLESFNLEDFLDSEFKEPLLNLKKELKLKELGLNLIFNNIFLFKDILKKLNDNNGLFPGDLFHNYIDDKIFEKLKIKNATFNDLKQAIEQNEQQNSKLKYLFLTGSNLSTGKYEIFSHLHTPDMIISDAVRISMSIPIIFYPHKYYIKNEKGERIVKQSKQNILYVDGGLLNNYPIKIFDTKKENSQNEITYVNNETLGFRLVTNELKSKYENPSFELINKLNLENSNNNNNNNNNNGNSSSEENYKVTSYLLDVVNFYFSSEESVHSERINDTQRTIFIDSIGITAIDFDLNKERKLDLINSGCNAVENYLQINRNNKGIYII